MKWKLIKADIDDTDRANLKIQAIKEGITFQALVGRILRDYWQKHMPYYKGR